MIKTALAILSLILLALIVSAGAAIQPVSAQGGTAAPTVEGPTATPTLSAQDILREAQQANDNADAANANASHVVDNANNAVNTVNLLLQMIQVMALIAGGLAAVTSYLGARAGLRTLNDFRQELTKARAELDEMRGGLKSETEQVRTQADRAIRSLALMQLGEQQLEMHNVRGALRMYQQAFDLDPSNRATNYFLGELYIQDKQLDKGIEHLQLALAPGSDYAPAEAALGYALRLQGDRAAEPNKRDMLYAQAEERLLRAVELDPTVLDINGESVHAALGALYKRQGRIEKAISRYEEARKITPQKSYPVVNLAILYYMDGQVDHAAPFFERSEAMSSHILDLNPYDYWARLDRATALLALGRPDDALSDLEIALQQIRTPSPLEIVLGELNRLKNSPQPPDGIDQVMGRIQEALEHIRAANPA